ncbi:MAG: arsenite methyltransferase [Dehalococcoidales bacterium]
MKDDEIRKTVRESYGKVALREAEEVSCCGAGSTQSDVSRAIGYSEEELGAVPEGANLGLGCGNPTALASLKAGEVVLDLGSGAGFDCFLASEKVGKKGKVIGVDMTPPMLEKARENALKGGYENTEFRLGEIENLPVADGSVDVVISNCVINLSPDKKRVFQEAYRVLKPGGRVMVSDITLLRELPDSIRGSVEAYVCCVAGAVTREDYLAIISQAGFTDVEIVKETSGRGIYRQETVDKLVKGSGVPVDVVGEVENSIISMQVQAVKPG